MKIVFDPILGWLRFDGIRAIGLVGNDIDENPALFIPTGHNVGMGFGATSMGFVTSQSWDFNITGITVSPGAIDFSPSGPTQTLAATVAGNGTFTGLVTWTTSNPAVALVSTSGVVTPAGNGYAAITATSVDDPTQSGYASAFVSSVAGVYVTPKIATMAHGSTLQLSATVFGSGTFSRPHLSDFGQAIDGNTVYMPDLSSIGVKPLPIGYVDLRYQGDSSADELLATAAPRFATFGTHTMGNEISVLDYENKPTNWTQIQPPLSPPFGSTDVDAVLEASAAFLDGTLDAYKAVNPVTRTGYYGIIPTFNYPWAFYGNGDSWAHDSTIQQAIIDTADVLFPGTYYTSGWNDALNWEMTAGLLTEAKRICEGKPVFTFNTYYAPGLVTADNPRGFIEEYRFRHLIEMAIGMADGFVLWSPPYPWVGTDWYEAAFLSYATPIHALHDGAVAWSSSNSAVATVDSNGLVTGISAGTATMTATSHADGTKHGTIPVTVT